jgi:hypothetical protein
VAGVVVNSEQIEVQNICLNLKEFQQMKFKKNANRAAADLRKFFYPEKSRDTVSFQIQLIIHSVI